MRNLLRGVAIVVGIVATVWNMLSPATAASVMMARTFAILAATAMAWVGAGLSPAAIPHFPKRYGPLAAIVVLVIAAIVGWTLSVHVRQTLWDQCAARVGNGSPLIPDKCGPFPRRPPPP